MRTRSEAPTRYKTTTLHRTRNETRPGPKDHGFLGKKDYHLGVNKNCLTIAIIVLLTAGCSEEHQPLKPPAPPSGQPGQPALSVEELLSAPDSLLVDGTKVSVLADLDRDFMLGTPLRGLFAGAFLNGSPPGTLPASITDVYVWAIRDSSEVWGATMSFQFIDSTRGHYYLASDGPFWDPGILVDVVIGVRTSPTKVSLVLVRDVLISISV